MFGSDKHIKLTTGVNRYVLVLLKCILALYGQYIAEYHVKNFPTFARTIFFLQGQIGEKSTRVRTKFRVFPLCHYNIEPKKCEGGTTGKETRLDDIQLEEIRGNVF